ncbi:hypothetical protein LZ32DRAFT_427227 [Colletotrichum eremochloae]|nr:hypothetical protein LZ32DRAFT_427227 [Colletotrichum eremochloae]
MPRSITSAALRGALRCNVITTCQKSTSSCLFFFFFYTHIQKRLFGSCWCRERVYIKPRLSLGHATQIFAVLTSMLWYSRSAGCLVPTASGLCCCSYAFDWALRVGTAREMPCARAERCWGNVLVNPPMRRKDRSLDAPLA